MSPLDAGFTVPWLAWIGSAVMAVAIVLAGVHFAVRPACAPFSARWFALSGAAIALGATAVMTSLLLAAT